MAGNITNELVSKLGMKNLSRGVKVTVLEGVVTVDLNLNIEYGKNILETSKKVQEKVKSSIENMTGLEVADVNIHIASVDMEKRKKESNPFLFFCVLKRYLERKAVYNSKNYAKKRAEMNIFF